MNYQYYLAHIGNGKKLLIRGNRQDWLSFAVYDPKMVNWNNQDGPYWADQILVNDFTAYHLISEKQALEFIHQSSK